MLTTKMLSKLDFENFGDTRITWLGSAGFLINSHGIILLIDPLLSAKGKEGMICADTGMELLRPYPINAAMIPKLDYVLYTHGDRDHLGAETLKVLAKEDVEIYSTLLACFRMYKYGIPADKVSFVRSDDRITMRDGICVEVIAADHPWQLKDMTKYGRPFQQDDCVGYIISTPEGRLLFPGDSRLMNEHNHLGDIAFIALDVSDDPYHMGKEGSIWLANRYKNADLLPAHYGTFNDPGQGYSGNTGGLKERIVNSAKRLHILAPGQSLSISK